MLVSAQYRRGDSLALECALDPPQLGENPQITWKPFPVCFETDLPLEVRRNAYQSSAVSAAALICVLCLLLGAALLQLRYGKDQAMYCGLEIDAALFSWMQAAVSVQGACCVPEWGLDAHACCLLLHARLTCTSCENRLLPVQSGRCAGPAAVSANVLACLGSQGRGTLACQQ
jgi:hypothetical protein